MTKKEILGISIFAALVLIVGAILSFTSDSANTNNEDAPKELMGTEYPIMGAEHIEIGAEHEDYNSNPPTSGPHYANPANIGFYEEILPDEQLIHNLEHGQIWISYKDDSEEIKDELRAIQGRHRGSVIVTRRDQNPAPIAVASWGRLMLLEQVDVEQIEKFISRNINNSPEPFAR